MKKLLLLPFLVIPFITQAQNPNDFLEPKVWLKADNIDTTLMYWQDNSGDDYHAYLCDSSKSFSANGLINFNKAVSLNNSKLKIPFNMSNTSQLTVFTVYKSDSIIDEKGVWSATVNDGQDVYVSTQKSASPMSIAKYAQGNICIPVVNTTAQYWGKSGEGVTDASMFLAGVSDSIMDNNLKPFSGDIAEFIVFDRLVGGMELQIFEAYLALKYGTTLEYSDYINSSGHLVWSYNDYPEYSQVISGIGRDDGFGFYQKQTSSTEMPNVLTVGVGSIKESNQENTQVFNNNNYLVWGMNNQTTDLELLEEEIYPYQYPVMQRKWLMDATGSRAHTIPTELRFNVKDVIKESKNCYLVIDRSGTSDFSLPDIEYLSANEIIGDSIAVFRDITWDTDKSGSDVFTLSFGMDNGAKCTHPICHNDTTGKVSIQVMGGNAPYSFVLTNTETGYKKDWISDTRFQDVDNLRYGDYKLVVIDKDNNTSTDYLTINNPDEFTSGLEPKYDLNIGKELTLDASCNIDNSEVPTFVWECENGFYSEEKEAVITLPGIYNLTICNKNGCTARETILVNAKDGIFYHYRLYPNPSYGNYTLEIALADKSDVNVRIYSTQGVLVESLKDTGSSNYLFKGNLNKSTYLIQVESSFGTETFKYIVN